MIIFSQTRSQKGKKSTTYWTSVSSRNKNYDSCWNAVRYQILWGSPRVVYGCERWVLQRIFASPIMWLPVSNCCLFATSYQVSLDFPCLHLFLLLFGWEYFLQACSTDLSTYVDKNYPIRTKPSKSSIHRTGNGPKLGFVGHLRHTSDSVLCCLWSVRLSPWWWRPSEILHAVSSHRTDRFCHRFSQAMLSPT